MELQSLPRFQLHRTLNVALPVASSISWDSRSPASLNGVSLCIEVQWVTMNLHWIVDNNPGKRIFWPKAGVNMLWCSENVGLSLSTRARSPRNMASLNLFRVGEGAQGLVMLCASCAGGGYISTEYSNTECCRGLRWWPVSRARDGQKQQ